jgi:hypothetical protein
VAFLRRALERDAAFEVSALARTSRGLEVRTGSAPSAIVEQTLEPFDVVLVGAPDELSSAEVDALRIFARRRGGTAVFRPDRRPSGRYLDLVPARSFEERLSDSAVGLSTVAGIEMQASELAIPVEPAPGFQVLASTIDKGTVRDVVVSWPLGAGRSVLAGALDAWRFRGEKQAGFDRFWRSEIAAAALNAPRRLEVSVVPAIARSGEDVTIQARLRQTEFNSGSESIAIPMLSARLVSSDGTVYPVRLWPLAETGSFEAQVRPASVGRYLLQVTTPDGASSDRALTVTVDARSSRPPDEEGLRLVASATGGVTASAGDLAPLVRYLRGLPRGKSSQTIWLARSPWFILAFAMVLGAEWAIRRRAGWP